MADIIEQARDYRRIIEHAVQIGLDDETAQAYPSLFPWWNPNGVNYYGPNDGNGPQSKVRYEVNNQLYKCISSHQSQYGWNPENAPSLWARMDDPAIEYPNWVQPTGAQDSYPSGAKVTHNGKKWTNTHGDGNVWEPGVYGWTEVV